MAATDSTVDMIDDPLHGMITPLQKDILVKIAQHAELVLDVMDRTDTLALDIRVVFRTWAEFNANWKEGIQIWNCVLGTCCKGQMKVEEYKTLIALANIKVGLLVDKNAADYMARQKKITASRRMAAVVTRRLNTVFENIRMGFIGAGDVSAAEDVKVSGEEFNDLAEKAKKFQADAATKASSEKKKLAAEAELAAKLRDLELREERLASEEKSVSAKKLALETVHRKSKGKTGKVKLFDDEAEEDEEDLRDKTPDNRSDYEGEESEEDDQSEVSDLENDSVAPSVAQSVAQSVCATVALSNYLSMNHDAGTILYDPFNTVLKTKLLSKGFKFVEDVKSPEWQTLITIAETPNKLEQMLRLSMSRKPSTPFELLVHTSALCNAELVAAVNAKRITCSFRPIDAESFIEGATLKYRNFTWLLLGPTIAKFKENKLKAAAKKKSRDAKKGTPRPSEDEDVPDLYTELKCK